MTPPLVWVADAVLLLSLSATVVTDLRWRRIPDWITAPTALAGLALSFIQGGLGATWDSIGLQGSLLGLALAGSLFALLSFRYIPPDEEPGEGFLGRLWLGFGSGGLGLGDVKLMGALGAVLGARPTLGALVFVAVAGGVQGILTVIARTRVGRLGLGRMGVQGVDATEFGQTVPYGLAIAVGTLGFRLWQHLEGVL